MRTKNIATSTKFKLLLLLLLLLLNVIRNYLRKGGLTL